MVFKVKNTGRKVTEFYLYGEDGMRIVGEVENVGPGPVPRPGGQRAAPGKYVPACKPGMTGKGIRERLHRHRLRRRPTPPAPTSSRSSTPPRSTRLRRGPVQQLVGRHQAFVAAYKAGEDDGPARSSRTVRVPLGAHRAGGRVLRRPRPRMDLREADLEQGQKWTGWHRIEKDLWPPAQAATPR